MLKVYIIVDVEITNANEYEEYKSTHPEVLFLMKEFQQRCVM